jgi:hypothetical protein
LLGNVQFVRKEPQKTPRVNPIHLALAQIDLKKMGVSGQALTKVSVFILTGKAPANP